jgi:exopolyphosphatase / guanosine-5'-triphosphate,3'-diphosphate pyrophosphatase
MTRVAAVDIGTNSTRLLVAEVDDGQIEDVVRETRITRLGEGVDARHRLLPVPMTRVRNVLTDYRRVLESEGAERRLLIATSAVRDAENGEAFLGEIEWSYGFKTRLLSGSDEALMMFEGVTTDRELAEGTVIVDIGGGSTELVVGGPDGLTWHDSIDIGSVRLTERFLHADPPAEGELEQAAAEVRALLADQVPEDVRSGVHSVIGVAGTITTLAGLALDLQEYDRDLVHGSELTANALQNQLERLASMPLAERRTVPALDPERAPVIVGGAIVAREVLRFLGRDRLEVSERDILDGAALAAAELPPPEEGGAPPGAYTSC